MSAFATIGVALGISTAAAAIGTGVAAVGVANSLLNKPKAPTPQNYAASSAEQKASDDADAAADARRQNPNYINDYGTSITTWGGPTVFDEAGYKAAEEAYKNQPGDTSYQGSGYDENGVYVGTGNNIPKPTREQFTKQTGDPNQATVTQTLTGDAKTAFENNLKAKKGLSAVEVKALEAVEKGMSDPFKFTGSALKTSVDLPKNKIQYGPGGDTYGKSTGVDFSKYDKATGFSAKDYKSLGADASNYKSTGMDASGYKSKTELDLSKLAAMPINAGMTAQNAIMYRLAPQIQKEKENLEQQLANQGVTRGSQAWNNALSDQDKRQNDLLNQAALSGIDADMAARLQGFNEAKDVGSYYNNSVGQNFDRASSANKDSNAATGENFDRYMAALKESNAATGSNYDRGLSSNESYNSAIDQNFTRDYNARNQANAAIQSNFSRDVDSTNLYNLAQNQEFNQGLSGAEFANTASNEEYTRQKDLYNTPLNTFSALQSGSAVSTPTYPGYSGVSTSPANIYTAAKDQGAADISAYGRKVAANNATTKGLFDIGGTVLSGGLR
jgi:hypothetical protein